MRRPDMVMIVGMLAFAGVMIAADLIGRWGQP